MLTDQEFTALKNSLTFFHVSELRDLAMKLSLADKGTKMALIMRILHFLHTGQKLAVPKFPENSCAKRGQSYPIHILVFEGLRDLGTQKMLFEKKLEEILLLNPDMSFETAEKETAKWVSPVKNNIPVHSTGAAVDIRLWDSKNNCFLDLGPFGVIWGDSQLASTFSEGITDIQKNNRLYCLIAAERAGLTNYVYEWWHFSFGDRYDVYWKDQNDQAKVALYGSVQ